MKKKLFSILLSLVMVVTMMPAMAVFADTDYGLEVNGIKVTDSNKDHVLGSDNYSVVYTPATDSTSAKLKLTNASIAVSEDLQKGIYLSSSDPLVIELIGENTISSNNHGIYASGALTFSGSGNLTVTATQVGIYSSEGLTFKGTGEIKAKSTTYSETYGGQPGINTSGSITLTSGTIVGIGYQAGIHPGINEMPSNWIVKGSENYDASEDSLIDANLNSWDFCVNGKTALTVKITPKPTTVADILPADFPTTDDWDKVPQNAWVCTTNQMTCYKYIGQPEDAFVFNGTSTVNLSEKVTTNGDDYQYVWENVYTITFKMDSGVLKSIEISSDKDPYKDAAGTYTPKSNWFLLADAMAGKNQGTVANVFEVSENTPNSGTRTIKLLSDITAASGDSSLKVPSGKKIVLDLNGYTIDRGLSGKTAVDYGYVVEVLGELMLDDNSNNHSGTITGGNNNNAGGGVYIKCGTLTMKDGSISGNTAKYGGGIQNEGTLYLTAGSGKTITITGNTATDAEGGIANWGEMHLSGKVRIMENTAPNETPKNLGISNYGKPATIDDQLTGSEIYVSHMDENDKCDTGILTSGYTTKNPGANLNDYFHYDGPSTYYMDLNTNGENAGELEVKAVPDDNYLIDIKKSEHGSVSADRYAKTNDNVTLTVTPNDGYELDTLTVTKASGGTVDVINNSFTMPGEAVTVTATFKAKETPTPTPTPTPSEPTIVVPVSGGEEKVEVSATVSGEKATVGDISEKDIEKVVSGDKGDAIVEIDLSGLDKTISEVELPVKTVEKIAEATQASGKEEAGMSVKMSTASVTFDAKATQAMVDQAEGNTIQLVVDDIKTVSLNAVQKEAVEKLDTAIIIDAYLVSNGTKLCTESKNGFAGGKATVALQYEIKNNRTPLNYKVFYVDDNGKLTNLKAKYNEETKSFVFDIEHFSNYAVAYDENGELQASKVNLTKTTTYKNGKIKLTFKRLKLSDGKKITSYQIYRSTSKKFNENLKKYSVKRTANTKNYTWTNSKKLKKGTKYYYKVRGRVKLSDGTYAYTQWSKVKTAKCKKSR